MADSSQQEETSENSAASPSAPKVKKGGGSGVKTIGVLVFGTALIFFAIAIGIAGPGVDLGEPTTAQSSGTVACSGWTAAQPNYQEVITEAANKVGIQVPLLGAIFLSENGDEWPDHDMNTGWPANGQGPFQITNWGAFWTNVQNKKDVYNYSVNATGSVENLADAALAAAVNLRIGLEARKIDKNTAEQKYIMYAGMYYNRGSEAAYAWADAGYDLNNPPANTKNPGWEWGALSEHGPMAGKFYAWRTWEHFQALNIGCESATPSAMALKIVSIAAKEIGYSPSTEKPPKETDCAKYNPGGKCQKWCAAFATWVYRQAGVNMGIISSAEGIKTYFASKNAIISNPSASQIKTGDIVMIKGNGNGDTTSTDTHHASIVEFVIGNDINTIDGNTTGDKVGREHQDISTVLAVGKLESLISTLASE